VKIYTIEGERMLLDRHGPGIGSELVKKGGREFPYMLLLRQESKGFDLGIDIGCNIGYTTIPLARNCKRVIAFEPDKRSRKLAQKNIDLNSLQNVELRSEAVSDTFGTTKFYMSNKPNQSSITRKLGMKKRVETVCLNGLRGYLGKSVFVKMDIEGAEVKALAGASSVLCDSSRCSVLVELHTKQYSEKRNMRATVEVMKKMGFRIKYLVNAKGKLDKFIARGHDPIKMFGDYPRAIFEPWGGCEDWCFTLDTDGKKFVRSILLERV